MKDSGNIRKVICEMFNCKININGKCGLPLSCSIHLKMIGKNNHIQCSQFEAEDIETKEE